MHYNTLVLLHNIPYCPDKIMHCICFCYAILLLYTMLFWIKYVVIHCYSATTYTTILHKMCCYTLLFCCIKSIMVLHKMSYYMMLFCCIKYTIEAYLHKISCYTLLFSLFRCVKSYRICGCDILHMSWLLWIFSLIYWRHHIAVMTCIVLTFVMCLFVACPLFWIRI